MTNHFFYTKCDRCAECDEDVGTKCEDGHPLTPYRVTFSTEDAEKSPAAGRTPATGGSSLSPRRSPPVRSADGAGDASRSAAAPSVLPVESDEILPLLVRPMRDLNGDFEDESAGSNATAAADAAAAAASGATSEAERATVPAAKGEVTTGMAEAMMSGGTESRKHVGGARPSSVVLGGPGTGDNEVSPALRMSTHAVGTNACP